jgi:hypothetical protein
MPSYEEAGLTEVRHDKGQVLFPRLAAMLHLCIVVPVEPPHYHEELKLLFAYTFLAQPQPFWPLA